MSRALGRRGADRSHNRASPPKSRRAHRGLPGPAAPFPHDRRWDSRFAVLPEPKTRPGARKVDVPAADSSIPAACVQRIQRKQRRAENGGEGPAVELRRRWEEASSVRRRLQTAVASHGDSASMRHLLLDAGEEEEEMARAQWLLRRFEALNAGRAALVARLSRLSEASRLTRELHATQFRQMPLAPKGGLVSRELELLLDKLREKTVCAVEAWLHLHGNEVAMDAIGWRHRDILDEFAEDVAAAVGTAPLRDALGFGSSDNPFLHPACPPLSQPPPLPLDPWLQNRIEQLLEACGARYSYIPSRGTPLPLRQRPRTELLSTQPAAPTPAAAVAGDAPRSAPAARSPGETEPLGGTPLGVDMDDSPPRSPAPALDDGSDEATPKQRPAPLDAAASAGTVISQQPAAEPVGRPISTPTKLPYEQCAVLMTREVSEDSAGDGSPSSDKKPQKCASRRAMASGVLTPDCALARTASDMGGQGLQRKASSLGGASALMRRRSSAALGGEQSHRRLIAGVRLPSKRHGNPVVVLAAAVRQSGGSDSRVLAALSKLAEQAELAEASQDDSPATGRFHLGDGSKLAVKSGASGGKSDDSGSKPGSSSRARLLPAGSVKAKDSGKAGESGSGKAGESGSGKAGESGSGKFVPKLAKTAAQQRRPSADVSFLPLQDDTGSLCDSESVPSARGSPGHASLMGPGSLHSFRERRMSKDASQMSLRQLQGRRLQINAAKAPVKEKRSEQHCMEALARALARGGSTRAGDCLARLIQ
eukprot:TRINITY_DN792_c0_g1_i1.p1 TRINITY_DN792_c0_g1~~TRINITY_DN792_c0_g1_i1.p1  ORF type:complete len:783 (+),score=192.93 TRINITY_DN792_c0_g1_i1:58-2349(+)